MAYFPFFTDIEGRPCTIAGGGSVAFRKAERLLPFGPVITVVSPAMCPSMEALAQENPEKIRLVRRFFEDSDIDGAFFIISATGDKAVSEHIYNLATSRNIPVNTVDDKAKCTFIFPALAGNGEVCAAVSTQGASPLYARYLKERINEVIDSAPPAVFEALKSYRPYIMENVANEADRIKVNEALLAHVLAGSPATIEAVDKIIARICGK